MHVWFLISARSFLFVNHKYSIGVLLQQLGAFHLTPHREPFRGAPESNLFEEAMTLLHKCSMVPKDPEKKLTPKILDPLVAAILIY